MPRFYIFLAGDDDDLRSRVKAEAAKERRSMAGMARVLLLEALRQRNP